MDRIDRRAMVQHLAVNSLFTLRDFCDRFCQILDLPEFHFDYENETDWGLVEVDNVEYNVSRPNEPGTLQEWDNSVPAGCNVGISLIVYREHPHAGNQDCVADHLVTPVAQQLADGLNTVVHFHRTWLGPAKNISRTDKFHPHAG